MRIAIDAMGGDLAPEATVIGAYEAARHWKDVELVLIGDESKIKPLLPQAMENLCIHHTMEWIGAQDEPVKAVRRKKEASMVIAGRMVKEGNADAMISAGNTGALMTTGLLVIGRIKGVERPGLSPMLPTKDGNGVLALDLGANMDAQPEHLLQYAIMGSLYREKLHDLKQPRVGLLNVGTEQMKGNELTKAAYPLLKQAPIKFVGNVESRDILDGACDVIVCDGFVGNILLKTMEGVAGMILSTLKEKFMQNTLTKLAGAVMKPGMSDFRKSMDYKEHGGAPLLGIQGVCIKAHGSSDAHAVKNAIRQARSAVQTQLIEAISMEFSRK